MNVKGLCGLTEPTLLEVLDHLGPGDLLQGIAVCLSLQQAITSPFLWLRVYCHCYRGHLTPPPSFGELAAGAAAELAPDRFPWRSLALARAGLATSIPAEERPQGDGLDLELAPPERLGMLDAEHRGGQRSVFSGTQRCVAWHRPLRPLPLARPIAYAELYVHGGCSVGLVSESVHRPNVHVGWQPNSLGYHGDSGDLYCGSGWSGQSLGPAFGLDPELVVPNDATHAPRRADVIGVGIDAGGVTGEASRTAFFTKNGALVGSVRLPPEHFEYLAFALHRLGDKASLNLGTCRFLFDVEAYSQEPPPDNALQPRGLRTAPAPLPRESPESEDDMESDD